MTHAQIYELGMKAYLAGSTLTDCPYDPAISSEAYDAWRDGWLDASASRAHWRRHSLAIGAHRDAKTSLLATDRLARDANSSPEKRDREVSIAKRWGCGHFGNLVPSKYEKIKDVEGFGQTRLRGGRLSYGSHV